MVAEMIDTVKNLPDSPSGKVHLKDWLKGLWVIMLAALANVLVFVVEVTPDLKYKLEALNFGQYDTAVKYGLLFVLFMIGRLVANNVRAFPTHTETQTKAVVTTTTNVTTDSPAVDPEEPKLGA